VIPDSRVVVTGLGLVSSAGIGKEDFWTGMTSGRSFIRRITRFDPSRLAVQIASEIDDSILEPHVGGAVPTLENRILLYTDIASDLALADSALDSGDLASHGGVVVGTSVGPSVAAGLAFVEGRTLNEETGDPESWAGGFPGGLSRRVCRRFNMNGPATVVSTGCASGADAIGVAFEAIRWGRADVMLAVGVEAPIEPLTINAFDALGALSHRNDEPARASRPFDKDRDGFVLGEGAAVLTLECLDRAMDRGAHIYGEIRGYATTLDSYHMTAPRHDLSKATIAVREALRMSGVGPADIDYVSAHATSTPLGDLVETRLVKRVFGERAYDIPMSSTKSVIGHQSGGAGVFQAATSLLSLEHQVLVPTVNLDVCGKDCDLDYVPGAARSTAVRCILQQTFGFSGKNSAIVIARADYPWRDH
jgi:3-oxoacyl-[acyl-carrier-protein] synthase II